MNYMERLKSEFYPVLQNFNNSPAMQRLLNGNITVKHYQSLMCQIFHQARENPQLQALSTVYFRGYQRNVIKDFYKHATSEIGHDQLALNDVDACGGDISQIPYENPLPYTIALTAFAFYQIYNSDPINYLGYLFFLEFMPTHGGKDYINALLKIGVPEEAMTFVKDHTTIDLGHNKLMERYVDQLITNDRQLSAVIYSMKVTAKLYAQLIQGAFDFIDFPEDYGLSSIELNYKTSKLASSYSLAD